MHFSNPICDSNLPKHLLAARNDRDTHSLSPEATCFRIVETM